MCIKIVNEGLTTGPVRPKYNGVFNALSTIGKTHGVRGLYQGVTPNMMGSSVAWGLYFML